MYVIWHMREIVCLWCENHECLPLGGIKAPHWDEVLDVLFAPEVVSSHICLVWFYIVFRIFGLLLLESALVVHLLVDCIEFVTCVSHARTQNQRDRRDAVVFLYYAPCHR